MWEYMQRHEAFVLRVLEGAYGEVPWEEVREYHERQIHRMQHERLIHLIVTMFCCLFLLMTVTVAFLYVGLLWPLLSAFLLVLVVAYLIHYFRLENGVQRWYTLADRLDERMGRVSLPRKEGKAEARAKAKAQQ